VPPPGFPVIVRTQPNIYPAHFREQGALLFGCNNTFEDFALDCWLACDPLWHEHYGKVEGPFDKWHWSQEICDKYGYKHVAGIWFDGLWMADKSKISLGHCSGHQLLNLAANQYGCDPILLVGHDFKYEAGKPRHYFNLSDVAGEYPPELRKWSQFKKPDGNDLMATYKKIANQEGRPEIVNCTPGSALKHFPMGTLERYAA